MTNRYLLDEHLPLWWPETMIRVAKGLRIEAVGRLPAPPKSTLDPDILLWCEKGNFGLVTNNRTSMPRHLKDFESEGRSMPGILLIDPLENVQSIARRLELIAGAGFDFEYRNQIRYLPTFE